ncbi:MAG TPA: FliH/SctL family protein [Anaeromyxobacteraceae bacterium]|nr:FliH/SctL family protein [Anaeromyxobacteraceae bacterium]
MGRILNGEGTLAAASGVGAAPRRVPSEVLSAASRARDVLERARAEAGAVLEAAGRERERVLAEAEEAGHRAGLARAAAALARGAAERDRLLRAAAEDLVRLAVEIARAVLAREVERDGSIEAVAARALEAVRQRREVTVRVHPGDAPALRREAGRLGGLVARAPALAIREDAAVGRGGLVVETEAGTLDARIETRLQAVEEALMEDSG